MPITVVYAFSTLRAFTGTNPLLILFTCYYNIVWQILYGLIYAALKNNNIYIYIFTVNAVDVVQEALRLLRRLLVPLLLCIYATVALAH